MRCEKCGKEFPDGAEACPACGEAHGGFHLEDLDLIKRFKVGEKVAGGFNIIAKFIDDVLKSFNAQLIAPYIKYKLRTMQTVMAVVVITVLTSAILAYLDVITGEAFVLLAGIVLGFVLATIGRMMGPT